MRGDLGHTETSGGRVRGSEMSRTDSLVVGDTPGDDFVYLAKQVPPELADRIAALRIKGVHEQNEYRRFYPGGESLSHILGFTGDHDVGQVDLEQVQLLAQDQREQEVERPREDVEVELQAMDGGRGHAPGRLGRGGDGPRFWRRAGGDPGRSGDLLLL